MYRLILSCVLAVGLTACAGLDNAGRLRLQNAVNSLDVAVFNGNKTPEIVLGSYESMYKKYPDEPITVGAYADALRRVGQPKKAADILKPSIEKTDTNRLPGEIFMPYMRLMLDQGFFKDAQNRIQKRLTLSPDKITGVASRPQLQNLLGVALAGQGKKPEAEQAFKQALSRWDGRPGVVEKNLERLNATKIPVPSPIAPKPTKK